MGALAYDYAASGAFEISAPLYRGLVALEPESSSHWLGLAVSLDETGDAEGAERAVLRAREIAPRCARALMKLGEIRLARGDPQRARAHIAKAAKLGLEPRLEARAKALLDLLEHTSSSSARGVSS